MSETAASSSPTLSGSGPCDYEVEDDLWDLAGAILGTEVGLEFMDGEDISSAQIKERPTADTFHDHLVRPAPLIDPPIAPPGPMPVAQPVAQLMPMLTAPPKPMPVAQAMLVQPPPMLAAYPVLEVVIPPTENQDLHCTAIEPPDHCNDARTQSVAEMLPRPCKHCRSKRVLCDRNAPCLRCVRLGIECEIPPTVKRGRPHGSKNSGKNSGKAEESGGADMPAKPRDEAALDVASQTFACRGASSRAETSEESVHKVPRYTLDVASHAVASNLWALHSSPSPGIGQAGHGMGHGPLTERPAGDDSWLPSPPTSPPEQTLWVTVRHLPPRRSARLTNTLLAGIVAAVAFVVCFCINGMTFDASFRNEGLTVPSAELTLPFRWLCEHAGCDHGLDWLSSQAKTLATVRTVVTLNLAPLPYLMIWAILFPENPTCRTPSLTAFQGFLLLWTLARMTGMPDFVEALQQYDVSNEVYTAQVTLLYCILAANILRLVLSSLFINVLWTINRLMHVANALFGFICMARLRWLGAPMWVLHPEVGARWGTFTCLCQIAYATTFHPANRQRLSKAFRRSARGFNIKGVSTGAYVGHAILAALAVSSLTRIAMQLVCNFGSMAPAACSVLKRESGVHTSMAINGTGFVRLA